MLTVDFAHFIEQYIYLVLCISYISTAILVIFLYIPSWVEKNNKRGSSKSNIDNIVTTLSRKL
jgi:Na+/H+ antiporter NhaC